MEALEAIFARRSIGRLVPPGPDDADLRTILTAAASAPDHGELRPFRFTVLRGEGMEAFGQVLEAAYLARCEHDGSAPDASKAAKERTKLGRAPLVVVVSAVRQPSAKVPWVEQRDAAAAAAENALIAATALGYGTMWRTGAPCYDELVLSELGLGADDAVVGFLYIGTATSEARKPPRHADLDGLVVEWTA